jgi:hypothetical protein
MHIERLSDATCTLEGYVVAKFVQAMRTWPPDLAADIYALSLYRDDHDLPDRPALLLYYNTRTQLARQEDRSPTEAKWNLALWETVAQHRAAVGIASHPKRHGVTMTDRDGQRLLETWVRTVLSRGSEGDPDLVLAAFTLLSCQVGRRLHDSGAIRAIFGLAVPIIMHDDVWDEAVRQNTATASPPGVADEFLAVDVF